MQTSKYPPYQTTWTTHTPRWTNGSTPITARANTTCATPDALYKLRRAYYGLVTYMDDKVGELLASLKENGLDDNTIVIFFSDHGDMLCEKEMVQKRTFYDWSSRVPFFIRFPDHHKAGSTIDQPVSLIDLLPTLCDMAGLEDHYPCDGTSLMPLIEGAETEDREIIVEAPRSNRHPLCHDSQKQLQIQPHPRTRSATI